MSWWIGVDDTDRNVTYNVGSLFRLVLPGDGIIEFDGAPASEAGGILKKAAIELLKLHQDVIKHAEPLNGWGSRLSAAADLAWLAKCCEDNPQGTVYVH